MKFSGAKGLVAGGLIWAIAGCGRGKEITEISPGGEETENEVTPHGQGPRVTPIPTEEETGDGGVETPLPVIHPTCLTALEVRELATVKDVSLIAASADSSTVLYSLPRQPQTTVVMHSSTGR